MHAPAMRMGQRPVFMAIPRVTVVAMSMIMPMTMIVVMSTMEMAVMYVITRMIVPMRMGFNWGERGRCRVGGL
jgi:hypothetical protein